MLERDKVTLRTAESDLGSGWGKTSCQVNRIQQELYKVNTVPRCVSGSPLLGRSPHFDQSVFPFLFLPSHANTTASSHPRLVLTVSKAFLRLFSLPSSLIQTFPCILVTILVTNSSVWIPPPPQAILRH